jgi:CHAT domain-containing protein
MLGALRDAAWVHVAAHGVAHAADPAGSGILLRDGAGYRTLPLRELRRVERARPWLVTLATCRSADAPVLPGGARICIPSALLDAGARGVIAALWPIEDASSVTLMEALYQRLRDEPPSVALARMQAELRARPAHQWAGLVFYGND